MTFTAPTVCPAERGHTRRTSRLTASEPSTASRIFALRSVPRSPSRALLMRIHRTLPPPPPPLLLLLLARLFPPRPFPFAFDFDADGDDDGGDFSAASLISSQSAAGNSASMGVNPSSRMSAGVVASGKYLFKRLFFLFLVLVVVVVAVATFFFDDAAFLGSGVQGNADEDLHDDDAAGRRARFSTGREEEDTAVVASSSTCCDICAARSAKAFARSGFVKRM